jgi:two-component system LytT family sensor kinase
MIVFGAIIAAGQYARLRRHLRDEQAYGAALGLANVQLERQIATAHLQTLRARVQPHFLFNALNAVAALVRRGDHGNALTMLAELSELLRFALRDSTAQFVPLGDELSLVQRYLSVERVRLGDRLQVEIDVPATLRDVAVPALLLQPLVENAVCHGVAESAGAGRVRVSVRESGDGMLVIDVTNTGPALRSGWSLDGDAGTGLTLTRERLQTLYGDAHRFTIESVAGGVAACVRIPVRR